MAPKKATTKSVPSPGRGMATRSLPRKAAPSTKKMEAVVSKTASPSKVTKSTKPLPTKKTLTAKAKALIAEAEAETEASPAKAGKKVSPAKKKTSPARAKAIEAVIECPSDDDDGISPAKGKKESSPKRAWPSKKTTTPKASKVTAASPAKKVSPGKKATASKSTKPIEASPPKPRGRPPKASPVKADEGEGIDADTTKTTARGRPKKASPAKKEPRFIDVDDSVSEEEDEPPAPKPRGRPKKTSPAKSAAGGECGAETDGTTKTTKKSPGRPKKTSPTKRNAGAESGTETDGTTTKRGRGRPKKAATPATEPETDIDQQRPTRQEISGAYKHLNIKPREAMQHSDERILELYKDQWPDLPSPNKESMQEALRAIGIARGSQLLMNAASRRWSKGDGDAVPAGLARSPKKKMERDQEHVENEREEWTDSPAKKVRKGSGAEKATADGGKGRNFSVGGVRQSIEGSKGLGKSPSPSRKGSKDKSPSPARSRVGSVVRGSPTRQKSVSPTKQLEGTQRGKSAGPSKGRKPSPDKGRKGSEGGRPYLPPHVEDEEPSGTSRTRKPTRAGESARQASPDKTKKNDKAASPARARSQSPAIRKVSTSSNEQPGRKSRQGGPNKDLPADTADVASGRRSKSASPARKGSANPFKTNGAGTGKSYDELDGDNIPQLPHPDRSASRSRSRSQSPGRSGKPDRQASPIRDRRRGVHSPTRQSKEKLEKAIKAIATGDEQRTGRSETGTVQLPPRHQKKKGDAAKKWLGKQRGGGDDGDDGNGDDNGDELARASSPPSRRGSQGPRSPSRAGKPASASPNRQPSRGNNTGTRHATSSPSRKGTGNRQASSPQRPGSAQGKGTSNSKPPSKEAEPSAPGRGNIISSTNPRFIKDDKTNPFFETMPAPEVWHRRMPPYFPFGETPFMERELSRQISEDLARSHEKAEEKKSIGQSAYDLATGAVDSVTRFFSPSRPAPPPPPSYDSAWTLTDVSEQVVQQAMRKLGPQLRDQPRGSQKRKASVSSGEGPRKRQWRDYQMSGALSGMH